MEVNQQIIAHRRDVGEFNDLFTCRICHGYMIDPTTVDYCYHTYCRSCILKHLLRDVYCPQCKGSGGKQITEDNLRSDDALRALIYKMIPGLYQRECQRLVEFEEQHKELDGGDVLKTDMKQEFFTAAEPISLSLEYHPAMLKHCRASDKPPVCYLQCPAGLRIEHLKKFLCSKYDIDAQNKQVEVEVTYEDEVLPPTQTLMDVGYCYHWDRHAPMSFQYRILLYESETTKNDENNLSKVNRDIELRPAVAATKSGKSVTFADEVDIQRLPQANKTRSKSTMKVNKGKKINQVQVQATAGRQRETSEEGPQSLSNFKSLRSNDMRYSDYGVSCSSTTSPTTGTATAATAPLLRVKSEPETEEQSNLGVSNMNIVVSIPQSQLSKSAVYGDEGFELKTANKKTTNATVRNLPKLKIELNSMKAKLSMPKSADARLEDATIGVQQQLDLETYAKNIGLKPIEQTSSTPVALAGVDALKYSPNASPMSSCSSSTNGSNGTADASTSTSCSSSSSSSHRKRKKKHSKEPKDANGKRKKLHAEISSQTDGKMKMKITTTHNHKAHKLDLKRSHSLAGGELVSLNQLKLVEEQASKESKDSESLNALNRTLGEEARSINNLMTGSPSPSPSPSASLSPSSHPAANCNATSEKLPRGGKEPNLPASPPLPPSLFKSFSPSSNPLPKAATPPLNPTAAATVAKAKVLPQKPAKPSATANNNNNNNNHNNRKPTLTTCSTPLPLPFSLPLPAGTPATPHFAVPHAPRQAPHQMLRYLSTPSSIASSANKQPKRSLSLDEQHQQQLLQQQLAKQPRLDYQQQLAAKLKAGQNRLYGPELAKPMPNMPMLCPTSYSLSLPSATAAAAAATIGSVASSVTITPRARNTSVAATATATATATTAMHGLSYPYGEGNSTLSNHPGLEIVRLKAATGRLMGPPKQPARRATSAQLPQMPLPMPAIVNSPPLSVALSAQRGNNKHNSNNSNNAAYRTSPPALINLRNNVPLSFPSKSAAKVELNSKKSANVAAVAIATTAAAAAAAANAAGATATTTGKANGTTLLDKSKTSLRDFRPPLVPTATTTATATTAKDADNILDLSAGTGRNNNSNNISSSSNSLEAALNKIKQNISANNNNNNNNSNSSNNNNSSSNSSNCSAAAAAAAAAGDDLQNLHMLSESATAREKISIKAGSNNNKSNNNNNNMNNNSSSSNIYENKPKNALVRPQNASVRSIPNPSALAFRNQATLLTTSSPAATVAAATATPTTTTTATSASIVAKPLTVKAEEKPKLSAATMLLSPNNNNNNNNNSSNNNNNSCSNNNNAATSPRATKKATTIDQVAANLNILAEAKAAALAEEAPLPSVASAASVASVASVPSVVAAKMPELEKTSSNNLAKTNVKESTGVKTTATATTTTAAAATATETTAAATIATTTAATTAAATVAATTTSATAAVTATAATATVSAATTSTATPLPLPLPLPTPTPTTTAAAAATATATATTASVNSDSLSKPPVQISATDTPVPVASSA